MKPKRLIVLTMILFIAVLVIFGLNRTQNKKVDPNSLLFYPGFSKNNCSAVLLIDRSDTALVIRKGDSWFTYPKIARMPDSMTTPEKTILPALHGTPADTVALQLAFDKLIELKKEELASQNPDKQVDLEVDTIAGLRVEPFDKNGKSLGVIYVGKTDASYEGYFVRTSTSTDVYSVRGNVRFVLFANPRRWRDLRIFSFDPSTVCRLSIASKDSGTVALVKDTSEPHDTTKKDRWTITSPVTCAADHERVETIVRGLAQLKATEIEGDTTLTEKALGFTKTPLVLSVTFKNGTSDTLFIGNDKVAMKWIRSPKKPHVTFTIYSYDLKIYNPGLAFLKAEKKK